MTRYINFRSVLVLLIGSLMYAGLATELNITRPWVFVIGIPLGMLCAWFFPLVKR